MFIALWQNVLWIIGDTLFSNSKAPIKCLTLNNQPCQAIPTAVNINSDEILLYQFTVSVNKCDESFNTINDRYARVCVPKK